MLNRSLEIKSANKTMAKLTFLLAAFFALTCAKANVENKPAPPNTAVSTNISSNGDISAAKLADMYQRKDCQGFFSNFPTNFYELNQMYGYVEGQGGRPLYSDYQRQIPYFFDCAGISENERLRKVVNIGTGGNWDADAVGLFQDLSLELVVKHVDDASKILDDLSDETASSFWFFLFDGPHPGDNENVSKFHLLSDKLGKSSKQSALLEQQFNKLLKSDKEDKKPPVEHATSPSSH